MKKHTLLPENGSFWGTFLLNRDVGRICSEPSFCEGKRKALTAQENSFLAKRKKMYSSPNGVITAHRVVVDGKSLEVNAHGEKSQAPLRQESSFLAKRRKLYSLPFGTRAANIQVGSSQEASASFFV